MRTSLRTALLAARLTAAHRSDRRVDLRAGPHPLQAVHYHELPGLDALADDAQAVDERPERDRPRLDLLVAADDQHETPVEIGPHGAVLDQHTSIRRGPRQAQAGEQPRRQTMIGVAEDRTPLDRPGRRIELVVEEL